MSDKTFFERTFCNYTHGRDNRNVVIAWWVGDQQSHQRIISEPSSISLVKNHCVDDGVDDLLLFEPRWFQEDLFVINPVSPEISLYFIIILILAGTASYRVQPGGKERKHIILSEIENGGGGTKTVSPIYIRDSNVFFLPISNIIDIFHHIVKHRLDHQSIVVALIIFGEPRRMEGKFIQGQDCGTCVK